ncbi:MAG: hypothetical protein KC766_31000, partial [Myxococcales bacterium]|nr:hypothetical protein [Myxococcales bacterium]
MKPTTSAARARLVMSLSVVTLRPVVRSAARAALQGRRTDPSAAQRGRFLRSDVNAILDDIWRRVPELLREDEEFERIQNIGNQLN